MEQRQTGSLKTSQRCEVCAENLPAIYQEGHLTAGDCPSCSTSKSPRATAAEALPRVTGT